MNEVFIRISVLEKLLEFRHAKIDGARVEIEGEASSPVGEMPLPAIYKFQAAQLPDFQKLKEAQ